MQPRFLKQKPSGYIYGWTPQLAERADMEPYEPPPVERPAETTSQNPTQASAASMPEDVSSAAELFRRQVTKMGRKPKKPSGET
jgi:hypothetical protein